MKKATQEMFENANEIASKHGLTNYMLLQVLEPVRNSVLENMQNEELRYESQLKEREEKENEKTQENNK